MTKTGGPSPDTGQMAQSVYSTAASVIKSAHGQVRTARDQLYRLEREQQVKGGSAVWWTQVRNAVDSLAEAAEQLARLVDSTQREASK